MSDEARPIGAVWYEVWLPTDTIPNFRLQKYTVLNHVPSGECLMESIDIQTVAYVSAAWNGRAWIPVLQNHADVPDWLFDYLYALPDVQRIFYDLEVRP